MKIDMRKKTAALAVVSMLILGVLSPMGEASALVFTNTGLSGLPRTFEGNLIAFDQFEGIEGVDLNSDGDTADRVFGVYDLSTQTATNTGLAIGLSSEFLSAEGNIFAFMVSESAQGNTDLNGDSDTSDFVMHVYNASTGIITNTGLSVNTQIKFIADGNFVAFVVRESEEGNTDLNGDADAFDLVLHMFNATTGTTTNTGLAVNNLQMDNNIAAFVVSETAQGVDLTGDADTFDNVLHLLDATTGTITNLLNERVDKILLKDNLLAMTLRENVGSNVDLNSDGDFGDFVLHIRDLTAGTTTNTEVDAQFLDVRIQGNLVTVLVLETRQGNTSLNGDADTADRVLHVFDTNTGTTTNTGFAGISSFGSVVTVGDDVVAFLVREDFQGIDLNGSGTVDPGVQTVHVYDTNTGTTTNLGLRSSVINANNPLGFSGLAVLGDVVVFRVQEFSVGDLNGDSDTGDLVLHLYDTTTSTITNVGLNIVDAFANEGNLVAFRVSEASQGDTDLNADGDATDNVLHLLDTTTGTTTNLGVAIIENFLTNGESVAFNIPEGGQGNSDFNGDGDFSDFFLTAFDPDTTIDPEDVKNVGPGETVSLSQETINSNIKVNGGSVFLSNCEVNGNVKSNGGILSLVGCTVNGNVTSEDGTVVIQNSNINGNVKSKYDVLTRLAATNNINGNVKVKHGQFVTLTDNEVDGNLKSKNNSGTVTITGNTVNGNLKSKGDEFPTVTDNTVDGNLKIKDFSFCTAGNNLVNGNIETEGCVEPPPPGGGGGF